MRMIPLSSSALVSVGYDETTRVLQVQFSSGRTYIHHDVPEEVFKDLLDAPSAGSYYASNVKGQYD